MNATLAAIEGYLRDNEHEHPIRVLAIPFTLKEWRDIADAMRSSEAVEKDAARYRWIRERGAWETEAFLNGLSPIDYDCAVDKAMLRDRSSGGRKEK